MIYVFFPDEFIDLQREILHHPDLIERLQKHPQREFEIIFAEVASYCEVVLDGIYQQDDFIKLAKIFTDRLRAKRPDAPVQIIVPML